MSNDNSSPLIDLVTVNYNGRPFLQDYFRSLEELAYPRDRLHVFFVDNCSLDGSLEFTGNLKKFPLQLTVTKLKKNLGFARANNLIMRQSTAEFIALLNNDTRVDSRWLTALVKRMQEDPRIGIAGSREVPEELNRFVNPQTNQASWVSGGHCLIRREALQKTGFFDEAFFMYAEDVDLCWRMWLKGYCCVSVPDATCEHHHTAIEQYRVRRKYFYVRNSILLRYAYGGGREIRQSLRRWAWEAGSLAFKRSCFAEAYAVALAIASHVFFIPHFLKKRRALKKDPRFGEVRERWINL